MSVVQSLWVGPSLQELQQLSILSFLAHGHQYHLYAYEAIAGVPEGTRLLDGAEVLPRDSIFTYRSGFGAGSASAFSNLFRYKLLLEHGGWWVDTDLVCLQPFAFNAPFVFATELDTDGTVNCATSAIKCPSGSDLMRYCVDAVTAKDRETLQWGQIGPQLFTEAVRQCALDLYRTPIETFNPVNYFDFAQMVQPGFDPSRLARSYAVHFWNQMWKNAGIDPAHAPPDSLYGLLRDRYLSPPTRPATL